MTNKEKIIATKNVNVFVMMKYSNTKQHQLLEEKIREILNKYDLIARLAKDGSIYDDLWLNVKFYMDNCNYGIAIFDEIDRKEINPNVSLELGYLFAQEKRCLLLKDSKVDKLPTDLCGKLYREFNVFEIERTIEDQVQTWCKKDLELKELNQRENNILERKIAEYSLYKKFNKYKNWPDEVYVIKEETRDGEIEYFIWNEIKERIYKYSREGVRLYGPFELSQNEFDQIERDINL